MHAARTSASHPIEVNWLTPHAPQVGVTFAPGKHAYSRDGARWERSLETDLVALQGHHRVGLLVNMLPSQEMRRLQIPTLVERSLAHGMGVLRLPVPDAGVLPALEPMHALVCLMEAAAKTRRVVVHCQGGLGRAGTVAGCFLVLQGLSPQDALVEVVRARGPRSPETPEQRHFIHRYAAWLVAAPRVRDLLDCTRLLEAAGGAHLKPEHPPLRQ